MAYSFDQVFAADPSNPSNVAQNASITIFAVGDETMTPLTITDPDGQPLTNPLTVNANGFASAFAHATLDRVAWAGGGFTGFFTSYEGMKQVALDAQVAAEAAQGEAEAAVGLAEAAAVAPTDEQVDAAVVRADIPSQVEAVVPGLVGAQVPPAVATALATDPTPANAAAAAVATKLTEAGVVSGGHPILADDSIAFSITGSGNRRSWIEIGQDGAPTAHAADVVARKSAPIIQNEGLLPLPQTINDGAGLAYVLVDGAGRKSELQVGLDGKIVGPFPERILSESRTAAEDSAVGLVTAQLPIAFWGDSLTESGWPSTVASELGVAVRNYGVGGQGYESIAARQGSAPALVTIAGDSIPASGGITVTSSAIPYSSGSGTGTSSGTGTLAGVAGTLSRDNATGVHTFTRATSGTAVWCPPKTPWVPDINEMNRAQFTVFWVGRNSFKTRTAAELVANLRTMVDHLQATKKKFLILEIPPNVGEEILPTPTADRIKLDAANDALRAAFPNEFVPVAQYLRGPALADGGITPTSQDNTDIANGLTPTSLRADTLHINTTGNVLIGKYVAKIIQQKAWVA